MGCVLMIAFGVYLVVLSHDVIVYPLDEARGILYRIQTTSDPQVIHNDVMTMQDLLPQTGNPVWIFPTDSTDFGLIQKNLGDMISTIDKISNVPPDSAAFHTGMEVMHLEASIMYQNLLDATPFMYVSLSFVFAILICIIGSMGLAQVLTRKLR